MKLGAAAAGDIQALVCDKLFPNCGHAVYGWTDVQAEIFIEDIASLPISRDQAEAAVRQCYREATGLAKPPHAGQVMALVTAALKSVARSQTTRATSSALPSVNGDLRERDRLEAEWLLMGVVCDHPHGFYESADGGYRVSSTRRRELALVKAAYPSEYAQSRVPAMLGETR